MNITLQGGDAISLDRLIPSRLLVTANSGAGKSTLLRSICEQTHGHIQQIIFDREGEFSTLREKYEYVLIGAEGDITADVRYAEALAEKVMELEVSVIIDLSDMTPSSQKEYVKEYLDSLNRLPRALWKDCLVMIDEIHVFAPEAGKGSSVALDSVALLGSAGRKRGFCLVGATQRLAKLNKDVAAEMLNKIIGRTSNEDMKRAAEELDFDKKGARDLRSLKPGWFWAYGPAISINPISVQGRQTHTHPPLRGSKRAPSAAPQKAIKAALAELSNVADVVVAEEEEIARMQRTIAELRKELNSVTGSRDVHNQIEQEVNARMAKVIASASEQLGKYGHTRSVQLDMQAENIELAAKEIKRLIKDSFPPQITWPSLDSAMADTVSMYGREYDINDDYSVRTQMGRDLAVATVGNTETKIINAISQLNRIGINPVRKNVAAFFAGYTVNGHFNNTLGKMRTGGLIDYPVPSYLALTAAGESLANPREPIQSLDQLHATWIGKLSGIQQNILIRALDIYPRQEPKEVFAEAVGYTVNGHFNNTLGKMRSLGLITKRGPIGATDVLFPPGLR